jgi:oxygen-independent coproporphyrinogen-3 oxidase
MKTTEEERMVREFILQMKLGRVSQRYFQEKFGVNVGERFREQFADLQARNLLAAQGEWIVLTREALLKVDTLLHAFFLPQHRGPRYV